MYVTFPKYSMLTALSLIEYKFWAKSTSVRHMAIITHILSDKHIWNLELRKWLAHKELQEFHWLWPTSPLSSLSVCLSVNVCWSACLPACLPECKHNLIFLTDSTTLPPSLLALLLLCPYLLTQVLEFINSLCILMEWTWTRQLVVVSVATTSP